MNRVTPLRPMGYWQHRAISFVTLHASVHRNAGAPYRSYRYALGAPPRISPGGASNATSGTSTTGC